jgi:hypothetical protein
MDFAPLEYVIPGYVVEGLTLLGGKPKLGKSWWAYDASIAVATGGKAMGVQRSSWDGGLRSLRKSKFLKEVIDGDCHCSGETSTTFKCRRWRIPRIDGPKHEVDEKPATQPQQQDLGLTQPELPKQLEQSEPTKDGEKDDG